ncbi:restriction endonuclease [[Limnothrix rosea] IAM M-220]|uniref:restriction endonuclease n=1 Tax=[Limnothrix rosea] IAM M-220 TaxID=454133 RepID=UPI000967DCFF|nr:restriction endonuclease [[Limnothrix rosea] IAM M-220]OKH13446.1 restriction endonuclease [[Limnothrix rosea] IAM M-220]
MAIPDYQTLMLPLLQYLGDGNEHSLRETIEYLAEKFELNSTEKQELLPSGKQPRFDNRVGWSGTHLKKSGLVRYPRRGYYQITQKGIQVLKEKPNKITSKFLRKFPEYLEFVAPESSHTISKSHQVNDVANTPEEILEEGFRQIQQELATDILDRVKSCSPEFFENLVIDVLLAMGYGGSRKEAGQVVGKSGDGGIDGIIKEDRLGLDVIYIQAKRWDGNVGRPEIQKFVGALQGQRARKGIFITTSNFTKEAIDYSQTIDSKIILINGKTLVQLMIDSDVGLYTAEVYKIKKIDSDYFLE